MKGMVLSVLFFCVLLAGCGAEGAEPARQQGGPVQEGEAEAVGEVLPGQPLYIRDVRTLHFEEPEEGYRDGGTRYRISGSRICMLRVESREADGATRLCLQAYDTKEDKLTQHILTPHIPEHENCRLVSADLTAEGDLSLKMGDEDGFWLVRTDWEGNILGAAEACSQSLYPWNLDPWEGTRSFALSDGRVVLSRYDEAEQKSVLTWFDEERGGESSLGVLQDDFVNAMLPDEEGALYYLGGNSLVRWDTENNTREELFELYENGVDPGAEASGLIWNEQGEILLCRLRQGKGTIYVLTDEEPPVREQIRLSSLLGEAGTDFFRRQAAAFTQNGGEVPISLELESREAYQEDYRDRVMAELAAGKGPDVLFVTREDMTLMQEKGMLCDLSDMIPQETRDVLIPGVLELGTVNGQLVGLVPEAHFETMVTPVQIWEGDGWSLEELLEALESREDWECPVNQSGVWLDGLSMVYFLLFYADTSFWDLEQGPCRFDSQEFVHILEVCKKYGSESSVGQRAEVRYDRDGRSRLLREGETAAEILHLYGGLESYSSERERLGEHSHIVGFPAESGSGNYVDTYSLGYLVVNARTQHREEISRYFSLLLDYDNQFKTNGGCVRMDVIRDSVVYDQWRDGYYMLASSDMENRQYKGGEIAQNADGSSCLEEYLAFVESCKPVPCVPEQIRRIVMEEARPFMEGRKEAAEAAEIIQRRVQLYLNEIK